MHNEKPRRIAGQFLIALSLALVLPTLGRAQTLAFDPFEATIPHFRGPLSSGKITSASAVALAPVDVLASAPLPTPVQNVAVGVNTLNIYVQ
jgi:hypothetical protein